jgi:hypothetical protein
MMNGGNDNKLELIGQVMFLREGEAAVAWDTGREIGN